MTKPEFALPLHPAISGNWRGQTKLCLAVARGLDIPCAYFIL